ncbi:putative ubiquitin carboxyl-terminal hydrolase [Podospora fimiseda]|uniref:Ubiquitin carboxyl-terminal hydrolase n=1 Tax=Podospora fimiseda TaxID=252190 RepID=A0AAN7GNR6_9PEZI|nr:putative ubiquitin carboxyl-terminal hydrolase [Podospora fimiseda]
MACPHVSAANLSKPTPADSVYREDCTQCFDSIDDPKGLDVCLKCFNGGCAGDRHHAKLHSTARSHPLALNIRRTRKIIVRDEPPQKMSKLAIAAETESDRYETTLAVKCLECGIDELDKVDPTIAPVVDAIMNANTFSRKEEVKAWEQELTTCSHILNLEQGPKKQIEQDLGHCAKCDLKENLWLCLECGDLGCGRAQFGGVGGNSHALAHSKESNHGVAVKLGSITPDGSADVYCYTCDEERIDGKLGEHLENWGIILAERQKTEKSLTELQIEQNLRWEFSMTDDEGRELTPVFGPGLTGLKNLGNSCYLASILQCLFDIPAFQERYGAGVDSLHGEPNPAEDLETQLLKIGDGLLSGRYSKPDSDINASEHSPEIPHQKGLQPSMFKHLIGRGHAEFSTMRQQDAFELLQHLIKLITRSKPSSDLPDPTASMRFMMEQRLQCVDCKKVRYSTIEQDSILIDVPLLPAPPVEGEDAKFAAVTIQKCLDHFTASETVELNCPACQGKEFTKRTLFKTFPEVLVVNARKMTVINWVPMKVDVPVIVEDGAFSLDCYMSKGLQPDEEPLPEDESVGSNAAAFVPNAEALAALEGMGFPRVRCEKALHATGNSDANAAMEWLFGHMEDPDIDEPVALSGDAGGGAGAADPEKLAMLESMGFSGPRAVKGLKQTGGDVERAIEWLFSHPDDDGAVEEDGNAEESSAGEKKLVGSAELPANFQLQSIVCHKGTSIHAGHYVAFIRKKIGDETPWVLFNDEKVVKVADVEEMKQTAYIYFFKRV